MTKLTEKEEFELIKEACLQDGIKLLLEDIKRNKEASDTIKVMPLLDAQNNVISSQTDQMLKRLGYVSALDWVVGIIEHYQNNEYQDPVDADL